VNNVALTYQNKATQRTSKFFAFFSALCLVISNNLLTHTHTHTHTHTQAHLAFNNTFFLLAYARTRCGVTPINKGLLHVPFVHVFVLFYEKVKKQNKDVLAYFFEYYSYPEFRLNNLSKRN